MKKTITLMFIIILCLPLVNAAILINSQSPLNETLYYTSDNPSFSIGATGDNLNYSFNIIPNTYFTEDNYTFINDSDCSVSSFSHGVFGSGSNVVTTRDALNCDSYVDRDIYFDTDEFVIDQVSCSHSAGGPVGGGYCYIKIDGNRVYEKFVHREDNSYISSNYTIDTSAYNDGSEHTITFESVAGTTGIDVSIGWLFDAYWNGTGDIGTPVNTKDFVWQDNQTNTLNTSYNNFSYNQQPFNWFVNVYNSSESVNSELRTFYLSEMAGDSLNINIYNYTSEQLLTQQVKVYLSGTYYNNNHSTSSGNFNISGLPMGDYSVRLESEGFANQEYYVTIGSIPQNITAYMWLESECNYIDFTTQNMLGNSISGATLNFYKRFNLTWVVVSQKITDIVGIGMVCLDEYTYQIIVNAENYETWQGESFNPTQSTYTIRMEEETTIDFATSYGVNFYHIPTTTWVNSGENYNFSLITNSGTGIINYFGLWSVYNGTNYSNIVSDSAAGGNVIITIPLNTTNQRYFNITYYFETINGEYFSFEDYYQTIDGSLDNNSLKQIIIDLKTEEDDFSILIITFFVLLLLGGLIRLAGANMMVSLGFMSLIFTIFILIDLINSLMGGVVVIMLILLMIVIGKGGVIR